MADIIEVQFKGDKLGIFRNPMEFPFQLGDMVVVEVEKGEHIGYIANLEPRDTEENSEEVEYNILRKATPNDIQWLEQLHDRECEALKVCKEKVGNHGLPMKLVDVEYQFDMKKLTFYFTADGRVDFRELVKDLAGHFRVRIDLRQIGARDETKRLGGLGICGQQLCCTTFLHCFQPVTTQMAKVQNLSLNPQKLSGCCGRLKCCLRYELDFYLKELQRYPTRESIYETERGSAIVEKIDIFKDQIFLRYRTGEWEKVSLERMEGFKCLKEGPPVSLDYIDDKGETVSDSETVNACEKKAGDLEQGGKEPSDAGDSDYEDERRMESNAPFPTDI